MWCVLELNLSVIGGCIPTIKPLLKEFFPRLLGTSLGRSRTGDDIYLQSSRKTGRNADTAHSGVRPYHAGLHSATGDTGSEEFIISKAYGSGMNAGVEEGKITRTYGIQVESTYIKDSNRH